MSQDHSIKTLLAVLTSGADIEQSLLLSTKKDVVIPHLTIGMSQGGM